jgi:hypothetical protein
VSAGHIEHAEILGGDHEHRHAVHDRRGEHEDFPSARSVGEFATDDGGCDDDDGLGECAEEYLLRYIGLGAADLVQQVVGGSRKPRRSRGSSGVPASGDGSAREAGRTARSPRQSPHVVMHPHHIAFYLSINQRTSETPAEIHPAKRQLKGGK